MKMIVPHIVHERYHPRQYCSVVKLNRRLQKTVFVNTSRFIFKLSSTVLHLSTAARTPSFLFRVF